MFDFSGKVVLVTGGSRGIGRETSKLFARFGAAVVINYKSDKQSANELMLEMASMGGHAVLSPCDISDKLSVSKMIDEIVDRYEKIDILVNNAGIWEPTPAGKDAEENLINTMKINLDGTMNCCSAVIPFMRKNKSGNIVNISSTAGQRGEAGYSAYAASKGAVIAYTKSLAAELAGDNIYVNCVAPGWVHTEMTEDVFAKENPGIYDSIPLKRPGRPEEIAWPILFLASQYASYIPVKFSTLMVVLCSVDRVIFRMKPLEKYKNSLQKNIFFIKLASFIFIGMCNSINISTLKKLCSRN